MPQLTVEQALPLVNSLYDKVADRQSEIEKFDRYYRGEQSLRFASDIWREFHAQRYAKFSDNWCGVVTDAPAQRLKVAGVQLDGTGSYTDGERLLWSDWQRNDLERQSARGIVETLKSRRSFVLVWGGPDGPVATWEDPTQVAVAYDPEFPTRRTAALKTWCDDESEYATLYRPEAIYKFVRPLRQDSELALPEEVRRKFKDEQNWSVRQVPDERWPLPNPLGVVPMVEIRNRGPLRGDPLSEIGGVVPMQDAINLLWAYLFTSADHASFPARVVMGMEAPSIPKLDSNGADTGQRIPIDLKSLANGRLLFLNEEGSNPSIGQWDAAKLDVFTDVIEVSVGHVAAQTRTPQHYLILGRNANPAAADALTAAEAGLVAKVNDLKVTIGPDVREVYRLMALARGDKALASLVVGGSAVWEDSENRSEAQKADAATKWASVGMPLEALIEKFWSNDPAEVARIMDMAERQKDDPTMASIVKGFQQLDRSAGRVTDGEPASG